MNESADSHREAEGKKEIRSRENEDKCSLDEHGTRLLSFESVKDSCLRNKNMMNIISLIRISLSELYGKITKCAITFIKVNKFVIINKMLLLK